MQDLLLIIIPIALVDTLMVLPSNGLVIITQLRSSQPILRALAYLAGFFLATFGSGLLIAFGLQWLFDEIERILFNVVLNPSFLEYVLQFIIGAALLVFAYFVFLEVNRQRKKIQTALPDEREKQAKEKAATSGIVGNFVLGFSLSIVGMPSAIPYFAAIDQMLKATVGVGGVLIALLIYNLIVIAPLLLFVFVYAIVGERAATVMGRVSNMASQAAGWLIFAMLMVIGIVFVGDVLVLILSGGRLLPLPNPEVPPMFSMLNLV